MLGELIPDCVDVLQNDGVEAPEMHREELVYRKLDEGELAFRGVGIVLAVVALSENEEGDHVDGFVALEPTPERANVVRRAAREVEQAHPVARDGERE